MTRKRFSKKALDKLLASFGGKCRMCQVQIDGTTGLEWDHRVPLALGGEDALSNLDPACVRCHRLKTKTDVAQIAKSTRQRQANLGIKAPKATIPTKPKPEKISKPRLPPRNLYEEIKP